jgi:hypothetical protein
MNGKLEDIVEKENWDLKVGLVTFFFYRVANIDA